MARRWYHEVSAEWLKARQAVLTATDVAGLLPEYKRYLKAGSPDVPTPGFSALWCRKHSDTYLDTGSAEAAARGHIMEPYAIDSWNQQAVPTFYHWDDCIICKDIFGFSPDGMVVPQLTNDVSFNVTSDGKFMVAASQMHYDTPSEVMEIKCYDPAQHMKAIVEDRMEHKELMQIAMSFVVLQNLEAVRLVWFCPGTPISMFTEKYTRDDLHDQIKWILEIGEVYLKCDRYWQKKISDEPASLEAKVTEEEIYLRYLEEQGDGNVFILK